MKRILRITEIGTIEDLSHTKGLMLVTDSQDVKSIKDYLGNQKSLSNFDGFFVKEEDGEYSRIYGFEGTVPNNNKTVYLISLTYMNPVTVAECPKCHRKRGEKHMATMKIPSVSTLERWEREGYCKATDGCKVEPDGTCSHGHMSWLLRLGYV